jgi:MFS superfamily sulfate permease-like transporter
MVAAVAVGHLETRGVAVVGLIPAGLPQFHWAGTELAQLDIVDSRQLIRLAGACFLLSYIESISAARTFAIKHHYDIDSRQELLGLGAANFFTSLWQGYPIAGGLSQTAVNEGGGARTPLAIVIAAASICCVLLFFTGLLRTLPQAVLAAVVLVAVKGLVDIRELRHLWRVSAADFRAAAVALTGVLVMGVLDGVMVAVLASVAMLLWHGAHPHVAFLGRIPGTNRFSDRERHPDNEPIPNVLIFRVQASLLYFNVDHVLDVVRRRIQDEIDLRRVICDLSNVPFVDISGARMLRRLDQELAGANIDFKIVEAHAPVRDVLRSEGLDQQVGTITRFTSLAQLVDEGITQPVVAEHKQGG